MNNKFFTIDNIKLLLNIFNDYMLDKFSFNLNSQESDAAIKKTFFNVMNQIVNDSEFQNASLQELNTISLTKIKEHYCTKYNLNGGIAKKPNVASLTRDKGIFGERPVKVSEIPEVNPYVRKNDENVSEKVIYDRIIAERQKEVEQKQPPNINDVVKTTNETAVDPSEFMKKLKDLEDERSKFNFVDVNITKRPDENADPSALYRQDFKSAFDEKTRIENIKRNELTLRSEGFLDGKDRTVIPRSIEQKNLNKYLSINSIDRDWQDGSYPFRYNYTINFMSKDNEPLFRYRNIESIRVGKVVIPDEIQENDSFNYQFSLSFPYLILRIEEFNDVYDGTNNNIRRAFCKLVFNKSYRGPTGRAYIVLKPAQKEEKYFYPAPLSALQKMTISLLKPNGDLLNSSQDSFKIKKIEKDLSDQTRLKITLDGYFDRNEFFLGDYVYINKYIVEKLVPQQIDSDIQALHDFINRTSGHEIKALGTANVSGYYNIFYIQTIGSFNKTTGTFDKNLDAINCLDLYNLNNTSSDTNGIILNQSLQHTISMKVNTIVDDAKILDTQSIFNF